MDVHRIIDKLHEHRKVFNELLNPVSKEEYLWKPQPDRWCLLEIVCHLYDIEREDFRTRLQYVLETPEKAPPSFDPLAWVKERNYMGKDFAEMLRKFLDERDASVIWLRSLSHPQWDQAYHHPVSGPRTARMYLTNWLAHDYLHIRQIVKLKYDYLKTISGEDLQYAGNWV
jgi:hypothetical protein